MPTRMYTVAEAKKDLSKLIREAQCGGDVYITLDGQPVVKIVPLAAKQRNPGGFAGTISCTDGAFDPLTDEELEDLGFE